MTLRDALHILTVCISLLSAAPGFGRGGETGTLDKDPESKITTNLIELNRAPTKSCAPYYLVHEQFRRLRARLSLQPIASIPGWDSHRAWRHEDRYFTEDGLYEILPIVREQVR